MKEQRAAWFDSQLDLDPDKLVFIDETWTTTNIARKNGRAAARSVPQKTATFVAGACA